MQPEKPNKDHSLTVTLTLIYSIFGTFSQILAYGYAIIISFLCLIMGPEYPKKRRGADVNITAILVTIFAGLATLIFGAWLALSVGKSLGKEQNKREFEER